MYATFFISYTKKILLVDKARLRQLAEIRVETGRRDTEYMCDPYLTRSSSIDITAWMANVKCSNNHVFARHLIVCRDFYKTQPKGRHYCLVQVSVSSFGISMYCV